MANTVFIFQRKVREKTNENTEQLEIHISDDYRGDNYYFNDIGINASDFVDGKDLLRHLFNLYYNESDRISEDTTNIIKEAMVDGIAFVVDDDRFFYEDYKEYMSDEDIQEHEAYQKQLKEYNKGI